MSDKERMVTFTDSVGTSVRVRLRIADYDRMCQGGIVELLSDFNSSMLMWKKKYLIKKLSGLPTEWRWVGSDGKTGGGQDGISNTGNVHQQEGACRASECVRKIKAARIISNRANVARLLGRKE